MVAMGDQVGHWHRDLIKWIGDACLCFRCCPNPFMLNKNSYLSIEREKEKKTEGRCQKRGFYDPLQKF